MRNDILKMIFLFKTFWYIGVLQYFFCKNVELGQNQSGFQNKNCGMGPVSHFLQNFFQNNETQIKSLMVKNVLICGKTHPRIFKQKFITFFFSSITNMMRSFMSLLRWMPLVIKLIHYAQKMFILYQEKQAKMKVHFRGNFCYQTFTKNVYLFYQTKTKHKQCQA